MNHDILFVGTLKKGEEKIVSFADFKPIGETKGDIAISYSFDGQTYFDDFSINQTCLFLKIKAKSDTDVTIEEGHGFLFKKDEELSKRFERRTLWSGADGIYSFNLDEEEDYDQKEANTLFVFGDTFVGTSLKNRKRLEPTKMVNNSLCYKKGDELNFFTKRDEDGAFISSFSLDEELTRSGYLPSNLTLNLGKDVKIKPYLSSLGEKETPVLVFDLHQVSEIKDVLITNFYDDSYGLKESFLRGVKELTIEVSSDGKHYESLGNYTLALNEDGESSSFLHLNAKGRFVRFLLVRKEGMDESDDAVGLNKVVFYDQNGPLSDVTTTGDSLSAYETTKSWFWLQDGYRKDDTLFIYPEIVQEELNGIEGFEFKIRGVSEVQVKIKDGVLNLDEVKMREVPFYRLSEEVETILGSAVLDNSREDGYLYLYGYRNDRKAFLRSLIVGRIKKEDLGNYNELYFYSENGWAREIEKAKPILPHVSTEMSVIPLKDGYFKGKYLATFQYDSIGKWVSYSIGETPFGPFSNPCPLYFTPELNECTKTTYTYNAKAHLHLSSVDKILVSYNVNDMSMKANKEDFTIYHPRFGYFVENK